MIRLIVLGAALIFQLMPIRVAVATAVPPCTAVGTMDIIPLANAHAAYCVSDYGWSDTWFVGSAPATYDPRLDVLSGDDSPNLHFGISGGAPSPVASGFGWISPTMDGGTLTPSLATGSPWTVVTPVHFTVGSTTAQSLVRHPLGLDLLITTTLDATGQQITQNFAITNTTAGTTFIDVVLADYFNYHPNGSTAANAQKGTVTYSPAGGIAITGPDDGTLIANGSMRGERVDDAHGRNGPFLTSPIDVLDMVQTGVYLDPGAAIAVGPGDVAGGLAWNLGSLAPGDSATFNVFKLAEPIATSIPEPAILSLTGGGIAWLVWRPSRSRSRTMRGLKPQAA